ncbi:AP-3 complex subunit beta-2 [Elysia marginata]|uniref:AP-3 complex subunit beta-2 n=1 Tax=Elysia marginata TaxID=1093978 RepID=A0AAV4G5R1_9GAST|nr:AP-3 complex subunit beta-2 [Elysia marginata]
MSSISLEAAISSTPQPRIISMADRQSHQEDLICSFIAENSLPLSLAPKLVTLAQELSGDHKALDGLKLQRTSATCKLKEGVSEVFRKRLVRVMKQFPFSINIDESTLKSNKKRVLNVLVCYFSKEEGKSVTHLYASLEMTVVNTDTVYSAVMDKFKADEIPLTNISFCTI